MASISIDNYQSISPSLRASERESEEGRKEEGLVGGRATGAGAAGQRPLVHTHIFSQMNSNSPPPPQPPSLLQCLYRSLLPACISLSSQSLDPPPNCQTAWTWPDSRKGERKSRELVSITVSNSLLPFQIENAMGVSRDILYAIETEAGTFAADAHVNGANLT